MKSYRKQAVYSIIFILLFGFYACTDNSTQPENQPQSNPGNLLLKFNNSSTPENITAVKLLMTREGYPDISEYMSLVGDSSAEMMVNNVSAGPWHLLVEALDSDSVVRYAGETDISVIENFTVQVQLTLVAVSGNGPGDVHIVVIWDADSQDWVVYQENPLISLNELPYNIYRIGVPDVIFDNGVYKMWYHVLHPGAFAEIRSCQSVDGFNWSNFSAPPVLQPTTGSWDALNVHNPRVVKTTDDYHLYYTGCADNSMTWSIGLATSEDGANWSKHATPVLHGVPGEDNIVGSSVVYVNGVYYLYYYLSQMNHPSAPHGVFLATSSDGINFTRYSSAPVISDSYDWESSGITSGGVIYDDDVFKMVYGTQAGNGLGYATSTDGKNFTKSSSEPFMTVDDVEIFPNITIGGIHYPVYKKFGSKEIVYFNDVNSNYICAIYRISE